jgi:hypothetical protein
MDAKKEAGACDAGRQKVDVSQSSANTASTAKSQIKNVAEQGFAVNDGLRQIGLIRPHGSGFEVYANRGDELCYLASAPSRAEALAILNDAASKEEARQ